MTPETRSPQRVTVNGRSLSVMVHSTWTQLQERIPAWERVLSDNPTLSVFSTPEWLKSWWDAFGSNRELLAVELQDQDGTLLCLAPLYVEDIWSPFAGRLRRLRFVGDGSGDSDNLDLIVRPTHESVCAAALVQWLGDQRDWHLCELNTLPGNSALAHALLRTLTASSWTVTVRERPRLTIDLPESWDRYLARLSTKERSKVRYYTRRLEQTYDVGIARCTSMEELVPSLASLFSLHQKRWQRRAQPGTFASAARRRFYWYLSHAFLSRHWLELWLLSLNGKPVAAQFAFRFRDTVHCLQEGFDPDHAPDSVGFVLRSQVLRHLIQEGVRHYDFLAGVSPSKERWGTHADAYVDLHFAKRRTRGAAHLAAVERAIAIKDSLRAHLPTWAWNVLRSLNQATLGRGAIHQAITP
jgi:CelD/BcsL family acetyltransferase involved in cellulose biosynthesis